MLFKTEYQRNEYTGEISTTPIKGETYCGRGGKKDVPLISAYRILPNGYKLEVNGEEKEITMTYMPLGISYTTKKDRILSGIWYEWISEDNFEGSFNSIFYEKSKSSCKSLRRINQSSLCWKTSPMLGLLTKEHLTRFSWR